MIFFYYILILFSISFSSEDINLDSDNDGYTDMQEEHYGSNPYDPSSLIYKGGWPYNINKSKLDDIEFRDCESLPYGNGCDCTADDQCVSGSKCEILFTSQNCVPKTNAKLPNLIATDQFGDQVELYDFANQGKYILIEVTGQWASPANTMAEWMSGNPDNIIQMRWWQDNFNEVKKLIDSGDIYYLRVMHQGPYKDEVITNDDLFNWNNEYPHKNIVNLADPEAKIKTWTRPTGYPCLMLFNPDMTLNTPGEGINGDAQRRRGLKAPFESLILNNSK